MWIRRVSAQAALSIFLVIGVIAGEPDNLAVALEGEDMGRDTVEKPAIMADETKGKKRNGKTC